MSAHDLMDTLGALDGLLRAAYQHGQHEIGWDALCSLCEDAVVAGLDEGEMDPGVAPALVTEVRIRLVVGIAAHYQQQGDRWPRHHDTQERTYAVRGLLHALDPMRVAEEDTKAGRATA